MALAVALVAVGALPWWLTAAIVARDVLLLSLWPLFERRGVGRIPVNFTGKTATASLLFGLTCLALSETSFVWASFSAGLGMVFVVIGAFCTTSLRGCTPGTPIRESKHRRNSPPRTKGTLEPRGNTAGGYAGPLTPAYIAVYECA